MKKSTSFLMGMAALLLSFGLILAGCPTDSDDDGGGGGGGGEPTIKLAQAGENQFTVTISGATWSKSYDYESSRFWVNLELDGAVTAEPNYPAYSVTRVSDIDFKAERTSDTVLTFTMSTDGYRLGSGKLKWSLWEADLIYLQEDYFEGKVNTNPYGRTVTFKIAGDSASVEFNFPKT